MKPLLQQQAALLPLGAGGVDSLAAGPVTRQGGPLHCVTRVTLKYGNIFVEESNGTIKSEIGIL